MKTLLMKLNLNLCHFKLKSYLVAIAALLVASSITANASSEVHVLGEMRRMFMAHDIGANVEVAKVNQHPHLYALGPVEGLKGEIVVVDGQVFVSQVKGNAARVILDPEVKSVFLVYASVPAWRQVEIPSSVTTEKDLATFLESKIPAQSRTAFLVHAKARHARYHIQNFQGVAKDLTHEAHDKAKVFYELSDTPVELIGFFTNREEDGGSFVHQGQSTHTHLISDDHKLMGHLESIVLAPGATLFLPDVKN